MRILDMEKCILNVYFKYLWVLEVLSLSLNIYEKIKLWLLSARRFFYLRGTPSGWRDGVISPFFRVSFEKQKNNWRNGVKMVHGVMALSALFSRHDSWNSKILGAMSLKWGMVWWRDRSLLLGVNRKFRLSFMWYMKGEQVE